MAELPDPVQKLIYRVASGLFHQPLLLRAVSRVVRGSASLSSATGIVASARGVREVLAREGDFSHGQLPAVMLDGAFLIGMPSGPEHTQKRRCLHGLLPRPEQVALATQQVLGAILAGVKGKLEDKSQGWFDLIEDYMAPLVWFAIRLAYDPCPPPLEQPMSRELLQAARWLGAQLMIGSVAPSDERQRALRSAAVLDAVFGSGRVPLDARWTAEVPRTVERMRDAIGLMWVGHPATTQGGALLMQELLGRPAEYRRLRGEMAAAATRGDAACAIVRDRLRDHVLELLRFRPPFPILGRLVPTSAAFEVNGEDKASRTARARPGSVAIMTIGALFDPEAQREDPAQYLPGRHFHDPEDRLLMFGAGPRNCIARDQVIEILITALAGLLQLGSSERPLKARGRRVYDGPVIVEMKLGF